jgi:hypothetical protein
MTGVSISDLYRRASAYCRRYGFLSTVHRIASEGKRLAFQNGQILYWMDLSALPVRDCAEWGCATRMFGKDSDFPQPLLDRLVQEHGAPVGATLHFRLAEGAVLWCISRDSDLIGYVWTLSGRTLKPYFFPLTEQDVHIFDNFILPQHRGRRYNSILLARVLDGLRRDGLRRAYIETALWNGAEQRSLARVGFTALGCARRKSGPRENIVVWRTGGPVFAAESEICPRAACPRQRIPQSRSRPCP